MLQNYKATRNTWLVVRNEVSFKLPVLLLKGQELITKQPYIEEFFDKASFLLRLDELEIPYGENDFEPEITLSPVEFNPVYNILKTVNTDYITIGNVIANGGKSSNIQLVYNGKNTTEFVSGRVYINVTELGYIYIEGEAGGNKELSIKIKSNESGDFTLQAKLNDIVDDFNCLFAITTYNSESIISEVDLLDEFGSTILEQRLKLDTKVINSSNVNNASKLEIGSYALWHEGNVGSNSGLDADSVDGIEGDNILTLNTEQTVTGEKTFTDLIVEGTLDFIPTSDHHYNSSNLTGSYGTQGISSITLDSFGHIISIETATYITAEVDTLQSVTTRGSATTNSLSITNTTEASSLSTGALTVTGGVGIGGSLFVGGNLSVAGTSTINNSTSIDIENINLELGVTTTPTNVTANGGGLILKGNTDKTFLWFGVNNAWNSSEHLGLVAGKNILFSGSSSGVVTLTAPASSSSPTITLPSTSGTLARVSDIITPNTGTLILSIGSAASTNNTITIQTGTGFNANSSSNSNYQISVAPALTNLASTMTGAGEGFIKKTAQDTYSIDSTNYLLPVLITTSLATVSITTLDSWAIASFRSCKYIIQITQGTNYQVSEVLVIHNGTTTTMNEYSVIETNGTLGVINSDINSGNVRLRITMNLSTNALIRISRTLLNIN